MCVFRGRRCETIENQGNRVFCIGCVGHKPKIGKSYSRAIVRDRDIFRLEIENRFVFLVVSYQVKGDFLDVGDDGRGFSFCCRPPLTSVNGS
jgi:hypothetical protein